MAPPTQKAGQKRKVAFDQSGQSSAARKRQKNHDARAIPVQRPEAVVSAGGELNVASFIKAREFEIGALEKSMRRAKKQLSTRAFQQVPRHMRRRTASHNAKNVPRRLRRRAEREMKDDNTPTVTKRTRTPSRRLRLRLETAKALKKLTQKHKTVRQRKKEAKDNARQPDPANHVLTARVPRLKKNKLAEPPKATTKYKRRQVNKTWLPTHLWHTKRAHMTRPTEPLWRMSIPLSPTEKSYRPSHRAAGNQGCIAWDTSYMSTVACLGTETALDSMLKALSFSPQGLSPAMHKKWKAGTRFARGWVSERDNEKRPIAPVTVIWVQRQQNKTANPEDGQGEDKMEVDQDDRSQVDAGKDQMGVEEGEGAQSAFPKITKKTGKRKTKLSHQILLRVHPSAFYQCWQELLKVAKLQKPQVLIEDLRFEIGSIEIQGPGSTEALLGVLRPFPTHVEAADSMSSLWASLAGLNNPSVLPQNAMLAFDTVDPRLNHPPKRIKIPSPSEASLLDETLVSWAPDKRLTSSALLSHKARWRISNTLPSQKAINRRRALAPPGHTPSVTAKDPQIPVVLLASRAESNASKNSQGTWTALLPWTCVDPVWRSLMFYPLSSGGTPRFGGLSQKQQLSFEQKAPWFPGDLAGTEAGKAWERSESETRFDSWIRRPPKHRVAWDTLDLGLGRRGEIGRGWSCDWEYLFETTKDPAPAEATPNAELAKSTATQTTAAPLLTQRQRKAAKAQAVREDEKKDPARRRNTSSPESEGEPEIVPELVEEVKYTQLLPAQSVSLLKQSSNISLPPVPVLVTVRITLLDKGTPSPAARIYRLPSNRKPRVVLSSTEPNADGTDKSQESQPQSWNSDGPPPGQRPPATSLTQSSTSSMSTARDLRSRWLALDKRSDAHTQTSHSRLSKIKANKFSIPRHQVSYPRESLAKINVLPKNAPEEIVKNYGPNSAFGRGDGEVPKEEPPPPKAKNKGKARGKEKGKEKKAGAHLEDDEVLAEPLDNVPDDVGDLAPLLIDPFNEPTEWDKHVPCPDPHDLIGFVTSGGYNLAEGRGTAVGSIWAQRVIEGWQEDTMQDDGVSEKQKDRQKRLCIVRNAGESVGRLGIWELCS
ncbi:uncharacterized protein Z520_09392 [Fonsecaea multimorphosa CBS 102226]|uniref:Pop1 N-terminal domain-containing protein n=1 Tax=Fonsecaea multimorphosa CBS 102226 TaxID=1442371 RepID=A0A0D2JP14_9EURO|nr:uncharacterized protein Z520_09392 [Fonsecaea multimorphosa CBS 102226]KIX95082.1 hypothetical protein Z520_09392 [Fonsecaea multimorphosa CBS 102226]OAL20725.1 hypothetical protein AYO22_08734 [Fonsecaea multimorphosa]